VKPGPFTYHAPDTLDEAVALLGELGDEAKVIAGGQSLMPLLAMRLAAVDHLVDVGRVSQLRGHERRNGTLTVRAATRDAVLERDASVAAAVPLLARATPLIGHFQIRNRGTVGGSIAHADPAAEYPAVALALDAQVEVVSVRGTRTVPAADFFEGVWTTSLEPDEVLAAVHFPVWDGRCGFAVQEFARRHGDFAVAGAVAAVQLGDDGRVTRCAIGLFGLGSTPLRAGTAERAVLGSRPAEMKPAESTIGAERTPSEVGQLAMTDVHEPPDDLHAPAKYRLRVGAAMVAAAWSRALEEAAEAGNA
jgi:carbon-monoxide dehydrogenase medium subunit